MRRNDLITHLSRTDNDSVVVDVNGVLIDVEAVTIARGMVVIVLNQEELSDTLQRISDGRTPLRRPTA